MTSLTIVRRIAARPTLVWNALTTPSGLGAWFGPDDGPVLAAETDLRVGGRYRVRFRTMNGKEHEVAGTYLTVEPPSRLTMTWRWLEGGGDAGESHLDISLRVIAEGTELTLAHANLQDDESAKGHEWGWNGALDKLQRHFADGATA